MPIGGDLGFAFVVILFVAVIAFEIRRRWRRSVARAEEVRRLVARVAEEEEAARADFGATVYAENNYRPLHSNYGNVQFDSKPIQLDTRPVDIDMRQRQPDLKPVQYKWDSRPVQFDSRPIQLDTRSAKLDSRQIQADSKTVQYKCALCMSPSTTRCARCKTARYCSGKCQILHWREGHKNECRPFTTTQQPNDVEGDSNQKSTLPQEGSDIQRNSFETQRSRIAESVQKPKPNSSPVAFSGNQSNEAECLADVVPRVTNSNEPDKLNGQRLNNDHISCSDTKLNKPSFTNLDMQYGSKDTPKEADGTVEISISGPYSPLSRFWERTINPSLSKVDSSPVKFDNKLNPFDKIKGSDDVTINRAIKKPVDVNIQPGEFLEHGSRSFSGKADGIQMCKTSDITGSEYSISRHTPNSSNTKHLSPQKSKQVMLSKRSITDPTISKKHEIIPDASVNLSSNTEKNSFQSTKKDDRVRAYDASHFEFSKSLPSSKNGFKTSMLKVVDQLRVSKSSRESVFGSETTGRYNEKGVSPCELFVKLYNWKNVEILQPRGLLNCGNSCYANAVIQCLACTPPLTAYLLQGLHSKTCKWKGRCFTCEFQTLMFKAKESNSPLSPAAILSHIDKIKRHFGNGKEEDAHEFLRYVIDTMQSDCLREIGRRPSGSLEEETTLIGLAFGGYLRSKIICMKCGTKSEQSEKMMDLTVEIEGDVGTLDQALRKFTSTEIMDGENKFQCSRCRSYQRAKKKFRLLEAPNILTIALKRFQAGTFGKINKWIRFPEILDLAPYMSGTIDKSGIYRLYGVIVHLDSMNATYTGHYVCYVKNAENKWFEINDSRVKLVDLESVLSNHAYMLLYARCSPRVPKSIRNQISKSPFPINSIPHSIGSWNFPKTDPFEPFDPSEMILKDDTWSESASSIFSEECSCSTESSNRDYSSTDDPFDPFDSESSSGASEKNAVQFLESNYIKNCNKLVGSNSCRERNSSRLGWANPFGKKSGLFRRSMKERT